MLKLQVMLAALVSAPYHADTEYLLIGAQQHPIISTFTQQNQSARSVSTVTSQRSHDVVTNSPTAQTRPRRPAQLADS